MCLSRFRVCSLLPCGHLLGKGWPLVSCLWCLIVFLSLSHVVSWVRCGTWLYRFLIFAAFLTYNPMFLIWILGTKLFANILADDILRQRVNIWSVCFKELYLAKHFLILARCWNRLIWILLVWHLSFNSTDIQQLYSSIPLTLYPIGYFRSWHHFYF